jgi:metal-responsive CopG/Arc/MetJ family transcriptional regulator
MKIVKTAISIPDEVFKSADKLATESGKSRSQHYAQAAASYVASHRGKHTTEKLNKVYSDLDSAIDSEIADLQSRSLPGERW